MVDRKGDKTKQTRDCTVDTNARCPNLKETGGGFEGEWYDCEVCGESYKLYYEDMR